MRARGLGLLIMFVVGAAACGELKHERPRQPAGWDDGIRVPEATDLDPSPDTVEVAITAAVTPLEIQPGLTTPLWTYNGTLPGPLIRAKVGDRVIVHFTNQLPEPTTIHWHGVRLTADMDGAPDVSMPAVPTGGSFDYSFIVPDASLFWYHPHLHSAVQLGDGLYGPLLVEDPAEIAARDGVDGQAPALGDPVVLVLSDLDTTKDGSLQDPNSGGDIATLFGREGNTILVNGRIKPTILARAGLPQRWRIVNAAKSRYFWLAADGITFTRVGGDGGLLPAPVRSDKVLVIPGGRADVVVTPARDARPGAITAVRWTAYDRGFGTAYNRPDEDIFYLRISGIDGAAEAPPVPDVLRTIAPIDVSNAKPRDISLTQSTSSNELILGIDGVPSWQAEPYHAVVDETDVWVITNAMAWDHPFHLHGFFFQEVNPDTGAPFDPPEWRDTFNVPAMQTKWMAVKYDDRPGMWMFHCHILDHAEAGMMGMLMVHED
jgi:FtsP/CotA-like multicopper oxidase with cupredoxin domain